MLLTSFSRSSPKVNTSLQRLLRPESRPCASLSIGTGAWFDQIRAVIRQAFEELEDFRRERAEHNLVEADLARAATPAIGSRYAGSSRRSMIDAFTNESRSRTSARTLVKIAPTNWKLRFACANRKRSATNLMD